MCCEVLDCTPEIDVLLQSGSDGLTSRAATFFFRADSTSASAKNTPRAAIGMN